jgi:hypothetical protein
MARWRATSENVAPTASSIVRLLGSASAKGLELEGGVHRVWLAAASPDELRFSREGVEPERHGDRTHQHGEATA